MTAFIFIRNIITLLQMKEFFYYWFYFLRTYNSIISESVLIY